MPLRIKNSDLLEWIKTAEVDRYYKPDRVVFVANKGNQILYFFARNNRHYSIPSNRAEINIVWTSDGESITITQAMKKDDDYITHTTGLMYGEEIESIFVALIEREKESITDYRL